MCEGDSVVYLNKFNKELDSSIVYEVSYISINKRFLKIHGHRQYFNYVDFNEISIYRSNLLEALIKEIKS